MSGPITAFKKEIGEFEAAWEAKCKKHGWPGEYKSPEFKEYWIAHIEIDKQRKMLEARHFVMPRCLSYAQSRMEMWAYITKVTLVVFWVMRGNRRGYDDPRRLDPAVVEVNRALHTLKIPWAPEPPYALLTTPETEDLLLSIANRLEREDLEAENEAENGEKTLEKIKDSKLRSFVCELQDLVKQHSHIPRGKKREIARRLCRNNLEKAMALERSARNWKHLFEPKQ